MLENNLGAKIAKSYLLNNYFCKNFLKKDLFLDKSHN